MTKKKETGTVKVFLPSGGSIDVPKSAKKADLVKVCVELDPAVDGANLVDNEDGSKTFVREMGTKGLGKKRDVYTALSIVADIKSLVVKKDVKNRKARLNKLMGQLKEAI